MIQSTLIAAFLMAVAPFGTAQAAPTRAAVFDLEFLDTSLQAGTSETAGPESARLALLTARLREALAASGRYELVDIAPVRERALGSHLQACGGCDWQMAEDLGAEVSVTGAVQKVSNLILNINLYVKDAKTGKLVEGYSADIRSNTDESWLRGLNWILKNRLLKDLPPQ